MENLAENLYVKFGHSKGTKFEKIFHLKFDATEQRQIESGRFFQILCPSQNVQTLRALLQKGFHQAVT
jgi:hypothetical protein